jgi:competence protein ComFB
MELVNLMEREVKSTINKILKNKRGSICDCEKCKLDIAAIALNNLKPQYVVTDKGQLYGKLNTLDYQFDVDLTKEITKAIEIVSKNPHH